MANIMVYKTEHLKPEQYKIFAGVYNDFMNKAVSEYKFELEPLTCEEFCKAVEDNLFQCIVLTEDNIPTAFLAATTVISDGIELNIIHCLGEENIIPKKKVLLERFLDENKALIEQKTTTYPMLGKQDDFVCDITHYGFKLIGLAVERFQFNNLPSIAVLKNLSKIKLPEDYRLENWNNKYKDDAIEIIHESFSTASDALFDPRFLTKEGCTDIIEKILDGTYGEFLPEATKVVLYKNNPIGVCLVNITGGLIANLPLVGIKKDHHQKGLGNILVQAAVEHCFEMVQKGLLNISEINASTETDNFAAIKMYRRVGFKEDYHYPQAYLPAGGRKN